MKGRSMGGTGASDSRRSNTYLIHWNLFFSFLMQWKRKLLLTQTPYFFDPDTSYGSFLVPAINKRVLSWLYHMSLNLLLFLRKAKFLKIQLFLYPNHWIIWTSQISWIYWSALFRLPLLPYRLTYVQTAPPQSLCFISL
jgi:hypothetical protein